MKFPLKEIENWIEHHKAEILENYKRILRIPAISPENGGTGEYDKVQEILALLTEWGWQDWVEVINIPDDRAKYSVRPNIIITYSPQKIELPAVISVAHVDVVPVGELSDWDHDPFDPIVLEGKLYGRGTEDNGLGMICSLYGLKCIVDLHLPITQPIKVVLVADEEMGSKYGIRPLIQQNLFNKEDLVLVPDAGVKSGLEIEVAEKIPFRAKIEVQGKQGHAARPNDALNAQPIANRLATLLFDRLHEKFAENNPLFYPPVSTFEPTKRQNNVANVNTLPGLDTQWWDCRLIPETDKNAVKSLFLTTIKEVETQSGAKITPEFREYDLKFPEISAETPVVARLRQAISLKLPGETKLVGIGGGTCAAFFRMVGIPAIVYGHMDHVAHQTNEYCVLTNLYDDIAIFAGFFLGVD